MTEQSSGEIGINNQSAEASMARFKARQEHKNSTAGRVAQAVGMATESEKQDQELQAEREKSAPNVVKRITFLGIPIGGVKEWFKKKA